MALSELGKKRFSTNFKQFQITSLLMIFFVFYLKHGYSRMMYSNLNHNPVIKMFETMHFIRHRSFYRKTLPGNFSLQLLM